MTDYYISTDKFLLNVDKTHLLLKDCFWSQNIPIEYIDRFIKFSLCFGIYMKKNNEQVGFGRVISDYTTYAYICDVIIEKNHRGCGLATALINEMMSHPDLQGLKTWSLRTTEEARKIYENKDFKLANNYETILEINDLAIYTSPSFKNLYIKSNYP